MISLPLKFMSIAIWSDNKHDVIFIILHLLNHALFDCIWTLEESLRCCWEECLLLDRTVKIHIYYVYLFKDLVLLWFFVIVVDNLLLICSFVTVEFWDPSMLLYGCSTEFHIHSLLFHEVVCTSIWYILYNFTVTIELVACELFCLLIRHSFKFTLKLG